MACGCCRKQGHNVRTCPKVLREAAKRGKGPDWVAMCGEAILKELVAAAIGAPGGGSFF
jgi:hypothetical protein